MAIGCAVAIQQGGTFEDYLMRCGVIAGSQIAIKGPQSLQFAMDDAPVSVELNAARLELSLLEAMTEASAQAACDIEYAVACDEWERRCAAKAVLRGRYERVLDQLRSWTPPGPMFEPFKAERIREIEQSIAGDCSCERDQPPVRLTATQWRIQKIMTQERVIEHLLTTAVRYKFVQALKNSLGIA